MPLRCSRDEKSRPHGGFRGAAHSSQQDWSVLLSRVVERLGQASSAESGRQDRPAFQQREADHGFIFDCAWQQVAAGYDAEDRRGLSGEWRLGVRGFPEYNRSDRGRKRHATPQSTVGDVEAGSLRLVVSCGRRPLGRLPCRIAWS
jgi:hypothetical protein